MSTSPFTQVEPTPWPSGHGDVIAVVRLEPWLFSKAFDISFFDGSDNLDAYTAAAIRLRSGRILGLLRHVGDPSPGTEIHADADDNPLNALREFLDAFDLCADDLRWLRHDVPVDHLRAAEEGVRAASSRA
ncbi:MAG TPA: hypothetical protein VF092_13885 [Longimicrobium sp.]